MEKAAAGIADVTAVIVGAGMSGLLAGARLKRGGLDSFVILEKSDGVGGTWYDNRYPGAACDVPSHLYSYSFRTKSDWSRMFAEQPEILDYFRDVAKAEGLRPHLRLNTEAMSADFDERMGQWHVRAKDGRRWRARFLIIGTGQLNKPHIPNIPGYGDFAGHQFHSARWKDGVRFAGKHVIVVGTGASAAQLVPRVAEEAANLVVVQRSPNWMIPRPDAEFPSALKTAFKLFPPLRQLLRGYIYLRNELNWQAFTGDNRFMSRYLKRQALKQLEEQVDDPELRKTLTPDYPIGCKRILICSDYYPALLRGNVQLETSPIERVTATGMKMAGGTRHKADIIIWATGFDTGSFVAPLQISGREGRHLADMWKNGAEAHKGTVVSGFPNLFVLYGPNTNLGHNSIIFMAERQMDYVMKIIETVLQRDLRFADVTNDAQRASNERLQRKLASTVWAGSCESWYKHDGKIVNNWSSSTLDFMRHARTLDLENFELGLRSARAEEEPAAA